MPEPQIVKKSCEPVAFKKAVIVTSVADVRVVSMVGLRHSREPDLLELVGPFGNSIYVPNLLGVHSILLCDAILHQWSTGVGK